MGAMKNLAITLQEQRDAEAGYFNNEPVEKDLTCACCGEWIDHNHPNDYDGLKFCSNICLEHYLKYNHYDETGEKCEENPQWDDIAEDDPKNKGCDLCDATAQNYTHTTAQGNVLRACSHYCLKILIQNDLDENLRYDDEDDEREPVEEKSF